MALVVVTKPDGGLISLDQARAQCRIDTTDDDELLIGYILAATRVIENDVQRRYLPQQLNWIREHWRHHMPLPVAAGGDSSQLAINQISYVDLDGDTQLLDPSLWWSRPDGETLTVVRRWFAVWPLLGDGAQRVVINFSVLPTSGPSDLAVQACRLLVSHYYENRDAVVGVNNRDSSTPVPFGVEALLTSERWS